MKTKLVVSVVLLATLIAALLPISTFASTPGIKGIRRIENGYGVDPVNVESVATPEASLPPSTSPFNVDMVDAEQVTETGDGIYVAVLDTGLLSNYRYFFPQGEVSIKTQWGKGYTHDVTYNPVTMKLDFGPLRDDRGFITHDYLNPNPGYGAPNPFPYPYWGMGSGHGTHVTSVITGWYLNRLGVQYWVKGVAPKVTIIPVLVLDDWLYLNTTDNEWWLDVGGTDEMVAAGIRYVGELAQKHKVKIVINMSLGGPEPTDLIEDAIDFAISQGVIVVASAGNEGYAGMGWPGAYPQVISAAAAGWTQEYITYYLNPTEPPPYPTNWYWWIKDVPENLWTVDPLGNEFQVYLTDFSSRPNPELGQHIWDLDVAAPGAGVKGPYKPYGPSLWGYYSVWGTSQAAPHVSAIAAMVLQKYPKVNQFLMELILKTAGFANRLTKGFETERSAIVFDTFSSSLVTYTWLWKDYGTGLLQADDALCVAKFLLGRATGVRGRMAQ